MTITLDLRSITDRLNVLNKHDGYVFRFRDDCIWLHDWTDDDDYFDCPVDPLFALGALESANDEYRKYGMPFILFG